MILAIYITVQQFLRDQNISETLQKGSAARADEGIEREREREREREIRFQRIIHNCAKSRDSGCPENQYRVQVEIWYIS